MDTLIWVSRIVSLVALIFVARFLWHQAIWVRNKYFTCFAIIAVLYPLGKTLQYWLIGPGWIRWYLSDVGWVSCVAIFIALIPAFKSRRYIDAISAGVHWAFLIAAVVELAQMSIKIDPATKPAFTAAGDPVDMVIFFAMYWINIILVDRMRGPQQKPAPESVPKKRGRKSKGGCRAPARR